MTLTETITWIPVEERVPESTSKVIACADGMFTVAHHYHKDGWYDTEGCALYRVTHWAEMPKGPT